MYEKAAKRQTLRFLPLRFPARSDEEAHRKEKDKESAQARRERARMSTQQKLISLWMQAMLRSKGYCSTAERRDITAVSKDDTYMSQHADTLWRRRKTLECRGVMFTVHTRRHTFAIIIDLEEDGSVRRVWWMNPSFQIGPYRYRRKNVARLLGIHQNLITAPPAFRAPVSLQLHEHSGMCSIWQHYFSHEIVVRGRDPMEVDASLAAMSGERRYRVVSDFANYATRAAQTFFATGGTEIRQHEVASSRSEVAGAASESASDDDDDDDGDEGGDPGRSTVMSEAAAAETMETVEDVVLAIASGNRFDRTALPASLTWMRTLGTTPNWREEMLVWYAMLADEIDDATVAELLRLGASAAARIHGQTALMQLVLRDKRRFIDAFASLEAVGVPIDAKDSEGNTALSFATGLAQYPRKSSEALLMLNADPNPRNSIGMTPLMVAAESGRKTVETLVEYGADLEAKDNDGRTALFYAAPEHPRATESLLSLGASPNVTDAQGITPLMVACKQCAKVLLEAGADPRTVDRMGRDAIMHAVHDHKCGAARVIVDAAWSRRKRKRKRSD